MERPNPFEFLDRIVKNPDWYLRSPRIWKRSVVDHFDCLLAFYTGYLLLAEEGNPRYQESRKKVLEAKHNFQMLLVEYYNRRDDKKRFGYLSVDSDAFLKEISDPMQIVFEDWKSAFEQDIDNTHTQMFAGELLRKSYTSDQFKSFQEVFKTLSENLKTVESWIESQTSFEETYHKLVILSREIQN